MDHTSIKTIKQLAGFLRCSTDFLQQFLAGNLFLVEAGEPIPPPTSINNLTIIEIFYIPKKRGGSRKVHSIKSDTYKNTLKILASYLLSIIEFDECVQGFVPGRNICTNAKQHLAKNWVLSVDIKDFFESIPIERVKQVFLALGFKPEISDILSKLTTLNGFLPQGYNTSPILSNLAAYEMDCELKSLITEEVTYTRYADDLYFSSQSILPEVKTIRDIVSKHSFALNEAKTKLMKRGQNQYVTGLTVFDDISPRVAKKVKRNLRLEIHYIYKNGYRKHVLKRLGIHYNSYLTDNEIRKQVEQEISRIKGRLEGWMHFIASIEPHTTRKFRKKYNRFESL